MNLQKMMSRVRKAIDDYKMINTGDKIAVGISGGKDSLTLLCALAGLRRFYPNKFELYAVTVDLGFENADFSRINSFCKELNVPYHIIKTEIGDIIFNQRKEKNPCSLCANMRKGSFNDKIKELGCNKFAYAHHKDDMIETFLMSLMYEGRLHCYSPVTYLDRADLYCIRPLMYVTEMEVIGFTNKNNLPVYKNPCPADGETKREYMKNILRYLNEGNKGVKDRIFRAIIEGNIFNELSK